MTYPVLAVLLLTLAADELSVADSLGGLDLDFLGVSVDTVLYFCSGTGLPSRAASNADLNSSAISLVLNLNHTSTIAYH